MPSAIMSITLLIFSTTEVQDCEQVDARTIGCTARSRSGAKQALCLMYSARTGVGAPRKNPLMHTADELERFQQGETRHPFAGYRDERPGLYYLEQGSARSVREYAKAHLRCEIASCAAPELTTDGRATRRDGFRHLNAPSLKHGLECDVHIAAKGVIERWAAGQDTSMSARLEQDPDRRDR